MKTLLTFALIGLHLSLYSQNWQAAFSKFDSLDSVTPPPNNPIVFTGSSSIRFWYTIGQDLGDAKILNRGFGGSEFSDLITNYQRVILQYKPDKLFIYSGDNDVANGKTAQQTFADFCTLYGMIIATLPETEVYVLSIKPSPSRWNVSEEMVEANKLMKQFCERTANLHFIDLWNPMLNTSGLPTGELFIQDSLHMNATGYKLWTEIISKYID